MNREITLVINSLALCLIKDASGWSYNSCSAPRWKIGPERETVGWTIWTPSGTSLLFPYYWAKFLGWFMDNTGRCQRGLLHTRSMKSGLSTDWTPTCHHHNRRREEEPSGSWENTEGLWVLCFAVSQSCLKETAFIYRLMPKFWHRADKH